MMTIRPRKLYRQRIVSPRGKVDIITGIPLRYGDAVFMWKVRGGFNGKGKDVYSKQRPTDLQLSMTHEELTANH